VDTVYFGGGTPSLLAPEAVGRLVERIRASFSLLPGAECTMEVNPGTVDRRRLAAYRAAGIDRLAVGVQSLSDEALRFLGRRHTAADAVRAVREAREAGFSRVGLDLIYGLPGQTDVGLREDLERAADLGPDHLSCYLLTVEPGTPLARDCAAGRTPPPDPADQGRQFDLVFEVLGARGYRRYEVSNFARSPSGECRHNRKYWTFAPYLGFGPSAHSCRGEVRSWNAPDLEGYLRALSAGGLPDGGMETLDRDQRMIEAVFLGLRMAEGIDTALFEERFGCRFAERFGPVLDALEGEGMGSLADGAFVLTPRGFRFADGIARRLVACL
jgi:oxygen-independent coproporphyrinogen-3 oxidase